MTRRNSESHLTDSEKNLVKKLLERGLKGQDIQHLVNVGRKATINSRCISEVKVDVSIISASDEEVNLFLFKKENYDYKTGLNPIDDSRLIYSREAMCAAVSIFNNPSILFKTESFCILANIAWTYLIHEFYVRKGISLIRGDGKTEALSDLIKRSDCPLSEAIKNNLGSLKLLRDAIEHKLPDIQIEKRYNTLFQACCLNFDKTIRDLFGEQLSLQKELSIALQFAKHDVHGITALQSHAVPAGIAALDAQVYGGLTDEQLNDLEYQFKVVYVKQATAKGQADMAVEFISPDSAKGKEIHNILLKKSYADKDYPFKPMEVCRFVTKAIGIPYSTNKHTQAYVKHKVRPKGTKIPSDTDIDKKYCIYHPLYKCYSFNKAWVDLLIREEKAKTAKP